MKSALKKAVGYTAREYVDEFSMVDGELTLTKRRVSTKDVPPDVSALKLILESGDEKKTYSLAELEAEKARLILEYKLEKNNSCE